MIVLDEIGPPRFSVQWAVISSCIILFSWLAWNERSFGDGATNVCTHVLLFSAVCMVGFRDSGTERWTRLYTYSPHDGKMSLSGHCCRIVYLFDVSWPMNSLNLCFRRLTHALEKCFMAWYFEFFESRSHMFVIRRGTRRTFGLESEF